MKSAIRIEKAVPADSRFIAQMIALASDGIACIEWEERAGDDDMSPIDIGAASYASDTGDYSYRNCWIARAASDAPVGMILSFALTAENCSVDAKPPPYAADDIYAPYQYLEAVDSWYICAVAVIAEYRGQDIGKTLIQRAILDGEQAGFDNTSLIVIANKKALVAYYQSLGFRVTRSAPVVAHPRISAEGDALLMETHPAG